LSKGVRRGYCSVVVDIISEQPYLSCKEAGDVSEHRKV
jgi:hypothetical protein